MGCGRQRLSCDTTTCAAVCQASCAEEQPEPVPKKHKASSPKRAGGMEYLPGMENLPEHLGGLALPAHLALQDAEKSNDLRKKLDARKAMTASVTQVRHGMALACPRGVPSLSSWRILSARGSASLLRAPPRACVLSCPRAGLAARRGREAE